MIKNTWAESAQANDKDPLQFSTHLKLKLSIKLPCSIRFFIPISNEFLFSLSKVFNLYSIESLWREKLSMNGNKLEGRGQTKSTRLNAAL